MSQKLAPFLHLLKEMVRTISQLARQLASILQQNFQKRLAVPKNGPK